MPDEQSRGSDLCTQCGLCCTGALHNAAVLDGDEIERAKELGLPVRDGAKPGFALPCPRLSGTVCTIYPSRPRVCARYKCQLLLDVEADATKFDDAVTKVATAKDLVRRVQEFMPDSMTLPMARTLSQGDSSAIPDAPERSVMMPLKLAITSLSHYLDKHFRNAREGSLLSVELVGDEQPDTEMT